MDWGAVSFGFRVALVAAGVMGLMVGLSVLGIGLVMCRETRRIRAATVPGWKQRRFRSGAPGEPPF